MSTTCNRCGASIAEGQRFCNSCGAPQNPPVSPAQRFCVSCGGLLAPGVAFCTKCGARATLPAPPVPPAQQPVVHTDAAVGGTTVPSAPTERVQPAAPTMASSVAPAQSVTAPGNVPTATNQTTATKGKGCVTAVIVALVVIVLIVIAIIGGTIYVAHRVKNKVEEFASKEEQQIHDSLSQTSVKTDADMSDVPGSFPPYARLAEACPDVTAAAPDSTNETVKVPLREGLTFVDSWRRFNGDVENIYKVQAVTPNQVEVSNSGLGFTNNKAVQGNQQNTRRLVCRADLLNAGTYVTVNDVQLPDIIPGTTVFSLSQKSLEQLKATGTFPIVYESLVHIGQRMVPIPETAEMTRVEAADVNYPVILNGQPTNLPVIHARGHFHFSGADKVKKLYKDPSFLNEDGEIFVLDDPGNPLTLLWAMGPVFQVRVVSIAYPEDKPKPQIEDQLAKQKKAVIYGIYFDFNQASIKKESEPVLKEIADAMKNNPDWVLTVNGYTDNIGGDAYNLDLSKKRAASVKKALVEQYGIAATRLATDGFGASGPVDTNETLEGRARNRRVELIRQ